MNKMTQLTKLLMWFKENGSINPLQAWSNLGIYRLSACIKTLRDRGYDITKTMHHNSKGTSYAIYTFHNHEEK